MREPDRRRLLGAVAGGAGLAGLAGCTSPRADSHTYDRDQDDLDHDPLPYTETYPDDDSITMYRGGLRRLGYYPDETVPDSVSKNWAIPANYIGHTAAKSTPLPTPDGETILIPADSGRVHARDPKGRYLWTTRTEATYQGFHGTPAVVDGVAYVGGYDGALYAFDVSDGDVLWRTDAFDDPVAIGSSPAYWEGVLYVAVEYRRPKEGALWAVDAETGATLWSDDRIWGMPHPSVAIDPDAERLVTASNDGVCYAWEFPSLDFAWEFQAGGPDGPDGDPQEGGAFTWGAQLKGTTALYDGAAFFGSWDGRFYRVSLSDGEEEWSIDTGKRVMSDPAVDPERDVVYVGGHDDYVRALEAASGEEVWRADVGGDVIGALAATPGTVLVGSYDTGAYALDAETGDQRWRVGNRGTVTSEVVPRDGRIYYAERAVVSNYDGEDADVIVDVPGHAYCLVEDS